MAHRELYGMAHGLHRVACGECVGMHRGAMGRLHRIGVQIAVQRGMGAVWGGCIGWPGWDDAERHAGGYIGWLRGVEVNRMGWGGGLCKVCARCYGGAVCGHGEEGGLRRVAQRGWIGW